MIIELVNRYGAKKWSTIAEALPGRIGKQCRERYDHWFVHSVYSFSLSSPLKSFCSNLCTNSGTWLLKR